MHLISFPPQQTPYLHTSTWQLWSDSERPWSTFRPPLFHHHCSMLSLRSYWAKKRHIPQHLTNQVDWAGISDTMSRSSLNEQKWIVKHNLDQCGVGQTLLQRRKSTSSTCPRCSHPTETTSHVMCCHGTDSDQICDTLSNASPSISTEPKQTHPSHLPYSLLFNLGIPVPSHNATPPTLFSVLLGNPNEPSVGRTPSVASSLSTGLRPKPVTKPAYS